MVLLLHVYMNSACHWKISHGVNGCIHSFKGADVKRIAKFRVLSPTYGTVTMRFALSDNNPLLVVGYKLCYKRSMSKQLYDHVN